MKNCIVFVLGALITLGIISVIHPFIPIALAFCESLGSKWLILIPVLAPYLLYWYSNKQVPPPADGPLDEGM